MAAEIRARYPATGATLYALVIRCADGSVYNGSGFETPAAANWGNYDIALTEQSTTQLYYGDFPAVSAGLYDVLIFAQVGGAPATTDTLAGAASIDWKGSAEASVHDLSARLPAALVSGRMDSSVGAYQTGLTPLQPTVAGRTLDVTATGAAGIDWANVEAPTTAVDLSGTTISTSQAVASVSGAVGSVTGNVGGNVAGSIGSLATQAKADVNAEADTALADVGLTATVTGRIDVAVSTRLASASYTAPLDAAGVRTAVGLASANLDTQLAAIAGYLDTEVAAILAAVDTEVAAIKAKTDNLPAAPAATGDIPTVAQIADKLLGRNLAGGSDGGRTVTDALRFLRNRWSRTATTLTVYAEDDTTTAWTSVLVSAAADPVTSSDPT